MADKLDREQIDERVLRLLGLEDVFDLDPDEYLQLIREKIEAERSRLSQEDLARLANERKRVRAEQRTPRKPKVSKAQSAIKFLKPSKVKSAQQVESLKTEAPDKSENIIGIVTSIKKTVDSIYKTLLAQSKLFEKINEQSRREREYGRRRKREEDLEKKDSGLVAVAKKILEPFQSIFDRIFKFLFFTLLGRAFVKFTEWASDPENKKKLEVLGRFLKNWWPALVGTYFLFGTSLGKFVRSIVGTVAKLGFHLAKFAIPKLLSFVRAHPLLAIGATAGLATLGASMWAGKEQESLMQKESEKTGKPKEQIKTEVESAKRSPFAMFGEGMSNITGFKRGGEIFSGVVGNNSGIKVSGYGKDTQYFPIEGTDEGAVLYPGEIVMNPQQQAQLAADTGVDPKDYVPGPKSGKVKKYASGGMIGIAANHLKQDEALSSLTRGVNDYVKPGGKSIRSGTSWSNVTGSTPIHSYIDSVGKATIGWGSTFYDNILNGKKPVRPGDTITKSKADDILATNLSNLAKTYSQKIPLWNNMSDKQKAGVLVVGYNAPYGPIGSYPKLTEALKTGNMTSAASNVTRGGPSPSRLALEKSLLMSGPANLSSIKKQQPVSTQSNQESKSKDKGIFSKLRSFLPFQGGGFPVKENTGMDIPGATADRQLVSMRLHPGEYAKIFTKDFVDKGGMKIVEYLQALLDSDSNARKDGVLSNSSLNRYIPEPPSRRQSGSNMITLPPQIMSGGSGQPYNATGNGGVPNFSAISSTAVETRQNLADMYGILG
jgi:GH24 family phage-related lysozyme (muramidase)